MNWQELTGWLALATTLVYVGVSYPREILEAIKGRSSMTAGFQIAASLTFFSWCLHSTCHTKGTNFFILVPNFVGLACAVTLTLVLLRGSKTKGETSKRDDN